MRKARSLALVAAGPVSRSFLARLPLVREHLGPVKSCSFRLASRISNALHAGFPVADYGELEPARVILISLPARSLPRVLGELAAAPVDWRHKAVILCDAEHDSSLLAPLAARGAATASMAPLEGFDTRRILVEGDAPALAAARRLLAHGELTAVELQRQAKAVYLAGITFLTAFAAPMLAAAGECLRRAGLSRQLAAQVVERLSQRALRSYPRGGGRACAEAAPRNELAALERVHPELAASYADAARLAARTRRRGRTRAAASS
jgi:predicted short-subunit dehydrogenase-like oxidoreductase (DUF2520 family)